MLGVSEVSWAILGPSCGRFGGLFGPFEGHLGSLFCDHGAILGGSWVVSGRREAEQTQVPKSFKHLKSINDFGLFGPSWMPSWEPLGPSLRPLKGLLGRLGPS
eukprot:3674986-Pyramimonas_sp.AAC.1